MVRMKVEDIKDLETTVWREKEGKESSGGVEDVRCDISTVPLRKRQEAEVQVAAQNVEVVFGSDEDQEWGHHRHTWI